LVTKPEMIVKE